LTRRGKYFFFQNVSFILEKMNGDKSNKREFGKGKAKQVNKFSCSFIFFFLAQFCYGSRASAKALKDR
jgi:hypothetical protein